MALLAFMPRVVLANISLIYPQQMQCKTTAAAILISGSRMRFDSVMQGGKYSMLFDGMEDMISSLAHADRSFHQIEVDECTGLQQGRDVECWYLYRQ